MSYIVTSVVFADITIGILICNTPQVVPTTYTGQYRSRLVLVNINLAEKTNGLRKIKLH